MMTGLSKAVAASERGAIIFKSMPESDVYVSQPRVRRSATLDGGVVIDHQGYVAGDRTIDIRASVTEDEAATIWAIYKESTFSILHTQDGSYYGAISDLRIDRGSMRLTFLVKEVA